MAINSQNDFQSVIDRLVKDENVSKTKREQGTLFERLVAQILRTQTHFKDEFKEVYLWNEFNAKFNISSQDIGVDIMARTQNDEWVSVQCKAYEPSHTLQQGDLKNFLGINNITKKQRRAVLRNFSKTRLSHLQERKRQHRKSPSTS